MSNRLHSTVKLVVAGMAVAVLAGCGAGTSSSGATTDQPADATSSRGAVTAFLQALERRDLAGMRQTMTPVVQQNESVEGGLLSAPPPLTSFDIQGVDRENPRKNASPPGSVASLRYTVALTPSEGFDSDDASGNAYDILVSETRARRWLVAELGGCC